MHIVVLSCSGVKYKWLSLVSYIWWQRWDPLPASRRQGPLADAATAEGVRKRVVQIARMCSARAGVIARERTTASKPIRVDGRATTAKRAGGYFIAESARATRKAKVARSKGRRKRARSAERTRIAARERARIAEVARDAEASETCKRSCVLPEGLARRRRGLSLSVKRLFIAVWITGRGVSELPWIAGRSECVRITDVPQCGEIGYGEAAKGVQSAGWCCKKTRVHRTRTHRQN